MNSLEFSFISSKDARLDILLLEFCNNALPDKAYTRAHLKNLISQGCTTINGIVTKKAGEKVFSGNIVCFSIPVQQAEHLSPWDYPIEIVFEDEYFLVINKPCGVSMHPGAGEHSKTVVNALLSRFKVQEFSDTSRPGVVHRLDKDTTGLVVLAKDPGTMAKLSGQFAEKIARRTYIALVTSTSRSPICESGTIDINLVRSPRNRKEFVTSNNKGKHAITHFKVLEYFKNGTLLELKLETGRTHQIRVHLKYMGHPVVGDKTYGTKGPLPAELKKEVESFGRQALHAKSLSLFHPKTEKLMTFFVDPPDDFISLISKFRNYK